MNSRQNLVGSPVDQSASDSDFTMKSQSVETWSTKPTTIYAHPCAHQTTDHCSSGFLDPSAPTTISTRSQHHMSQFIDDEAMESKSPVTSPTQSYPDEQGSPYRGDSDVEDTKTPSPEPTYGPVKRRGPPWWRQNRPYRSNKSWNARTGEEKTNGPLNEGSHREWFLTIYATEDQQRLYEEKGEVPMDGDEPAIPLGVNHPHLLAYTGQWECGGATDKQNKLHWQGMVRFTNAIARGGVRIRLGVNGVNLAPQHYLEPVINREGALKYVTKLESRVASTRGRGKWPAAVGAPDGEQPGVGSDDTGAAKRPGGRPSMDTRIKYWVSRFRDGTATPDTVMDEEPTLWSRHQRVLEAQAIKCRPPRSKHIDLEVHVGPTGVGKTHHVNQTYPDGYRKVLSHESWERYIAQRTVILEDVSCGGRSDKSIVTPQWLNPLCDPVDVPVNIKYGSGSMYADRFVLTTNVNPEDWWPELQGTGILNAMLARITSLYIWEYKPGFGEHNAKQNRGSAAGTWKRYSTYDDYKQNHGKISDKKAQAVRVSQYRMADAHTDLTWNSAPKAMLSPEQIADRDDLVTWIRDGEMEGWGRKKITEYALKTFGGKGGLNLFTLKQAFDNLDLQ